MNIWSVLGLSTTFVATFCIFMLEVFQDNRYYETYKWYFCGFLIVSGAVMWLVGQYLKRRSAPKPAEGPQPQPQPANSASQEAPPVRDETAPAQEPTSVPPVEDNAEQAEPEEEEDSEEVAEIQGGPFFLFTPTYWGAMLVIFGIIVVFIVPQYSARKVAARTAPAVPKTNLVVAPVATNTNAAPVFIPVETAKFPNIKLQGIIYKVQSPSVVINGKAYFVGDFVEDAEIVRIDRNSMTMEIRGQQKVVVLEK